ncbi:MAG: biotin--[acetyl-CoA-carboxylase] ligase [Deltaproteobacteria bacterium]|nr:MAG: biotin--[acetyl-CoA-carboxylase] ligase [Deltaproteobacteria bacterium]
MVDKQKVHNSSVTVPGELCQSACQYKALNLNLLNKILAGSMFSGRIYYKESVDSTNKVARNLGDSGAPHGTVVVSEYQSAGKGRMRRKWFAPQGVNLLFSVILRPQSMRAKREEWQDDMFLFTAVAAISLVNAMKAMCGVEGQIKWPNDIYLGGKKLAGILGEFSFDSCFLEYVIVGVGVNVHWAPAEREVGGQRATCIDAETGSPTCRTKLLGDILLEMERQYRCLEADGKHKILSTYKANSVVLGREITVVDRGNVAVCKAIDILADGSLLVLDRGNNQRSLRWGDVSLRL